MEVSAAIALIRNDHLRTNHPVLWADLGCGTGLFTLALAHLLPAGSTVYAVDKNPSALRHLSPSKAGIGVQKVEADFTGENLRLPPLYHFHLTIAYIREVTQLDEGLGVSPVGG